MVVPRRLVLAGATLAVVAVIAPVPTVGEALAPTGRLFVVQAVPGTTYDVSVDGAEEAEADGGTVLGPFELAAGEHSVRFALDEGEPMTATVLVREGASSDLVLHAPAEAGGSPVADVYRAPTGPVEPGMARVLVAHTATVPPADVRVDGTTVFENIANGEYAVADLPAGGHSAAIVPAGTTGDPILGPLDVQLPAGTLTLVYAVGSPRDGSMNVITRQTSVPTSDSAPPREIRTGTAGLVRSTPGEFGSG